MVPIYINIYIYTVYIIIYIYAPVGGVNVDTGCLKQLALDLLTLKLVETPRRLFICEHPTKIQAFVEAWVPGSFDDLTIGISWGAPILSALLFYPLVI